MKTVKENTKALAKARAAVEAHPMCARIKIEGRRAIIFYPHGDFPVDGIRTERSAAGFEKALAVMERHWINSYPAGRTHSWMQ